MSKTLRRMAIGMALVALTALGGLGCGGAGRSSPGASGSGGMSPGLGSGGAGGSSVGGSTVDPGGAGGSSGASASGGALTLGDSLAEGCIAYATAVCERDAECALQTPRGCLDVSRDCPDIVGSPGATRTPAGLKACAETYKTLPCEKVLRGELPDCVTPGLRARGEPCTYPSQCSSLNCTYEAGCGLCVVEVGDGESCIAEDVVCRSGAYCSDGVCPAAAVLTVAGPNEACGPTTSCGAGYYCAQNGGPNGVCTPLPSAGQPCTPGLQCGDQAYCRQPTAMCMAYPGLGQPCGLLNDFIDEIPPGFYCAKGLLCSGADVDTKQAGTCVAKPQTGEPCVISPYVRDEGCAPTLRCDTSVSPSICTALGKPGAACAYSFDCEEGLLCGCPDGNPMCEQATCMTVHYVGEPCSPGDLSKRCHPAFDCKDGTCQPGELRGVFAKACGP